MRKLIFILLFAGCASFPPERALNHYATLQNNLGGLSSAVCVGNGLVLASEHALFDIEGKYLGGILIFKDRIDSNIKVIYSDQEVSLLYSQITHTVPSLSLDSLTIGREVFWIHPFYTQSLTSEYRAYLLFMRGVVASRLSENEYLIDREVWPGSSGSGVYDSSGDLVGIIYGYLGFRSPKSIIYFGLINPLPNRIKTIISEMGTSSFKAKHIH